MEEVIQGKTYFYQETEKVPSCFGCKYWLNLPQLAPCCNCQGCNLTGKSFYQPIGIKIELKKIINK